MPIYEYQCTECGALHEALQKVSDSLLVDCPACGKPGLRKKVTAAAFRLKGGGWYETDFKSGNKKNLAGDGASDKPASGSSSEAAKSGAKDSANSAGSAGAEKSASKPATGGSGSASKGSGESSA